MDSVWSLSKLSNIFTEMGKFILKIYVESQRAPRHFRQFYRRKTKLEGGLTFPDFRSDYKAAIIKKCGTGMKVVVL